MVQTCWSFMKQEWLTDCPQGWSWLPGPLKLCDPKPHPRSHGPLSQVASSHLKTIKYSWPCPNQRQSYQIQQRLPPSSQRQIFSLFYREHCGSPEFREFKKTWHSPGEYQVVAILNVWIVLRSVQTDKCEFQVSQLWSGKFYTGHFISLKLGLLIYEMENTVVH